MIPSNTSTPIKNSTNTDTTASPGCDIGDNTTPSGREQGRSKQSRANPSSTTPGTLNSFWTAKQPSSTPLTSLGHTRSGNKSTTSPSLTNVRMELISPTTTTQQPQAMQIDNDSSTDVSSSLTSKDLPTPTLRSSLKKAKSKTTKSSSTPPPAPIVHPTLDSYKFKVVIEISANIRKTEKVYPVLREKILAGLSFIHSAVDPTAAFLPLPTVARTIPIYDEASFPHDQFTTGMNFFVYQNDYSLFPIKNENRWVRLSVNMGFNVDPHSFLHIMKVDLMDLGATFEIKQEQALTTCSNIVFLGAPNCINKSYAKEVLDMYLIPLEKELMESDPLTYPPSIHGLPWPSYSMVIEQPGGLFEAPQKGMKRVPPPRERKTLQLLCAAEAYDRLAALIKAAKRRGLWTAEFGNGQCFPVEVPEPDANKLTKDNYKVMIETHCSAQIGMGYGTFSGVKDDRVEMTIARLPDEKGPRAPVTITLRHVLRRMQFKGYPLWICLVRTDKKQGFDIFYDGQCPITTSYVHEFLKCPAAQIMFWLLKRGFDKEQVEAFITATFNLEQCTLCTQSKYNADIKLAQVATMEEDMDIFTASRRKGSKINTDLGLSPERISIRQAQLKATVCNLGKFDFTKPQDLRTVAGNASVGEWSKDATLGKSIYQLGHPSDASNSSTSHMGSDGEEDDDDEVEIIDTTEDDNPGEVERTGGMEGGIARTVHFSMDLPGGQMSDKLVLPETREVAPLILPTLQRNPIMSETSDMQGVETEETFTPSGIFAQTLWDLAPENYKVLFGILDQLESEIRQSRDMISPQMEIPLTTMALIQDDLREKLVAGAGELDLLEFVDNVRTMFEELRSADAEAKMELEDLFRKRMREEADDLLEEEAYVSEEEVDGRNNDGISATGLPNPSAASSLQMAAAGGTVNPQGSLLSVDVPDGHNEVGTAPAGGASG